MRRREKEQNTGQKQQGRQRKNDLLLAGGVAFVAVIGLGALFLLRQPGASVVIYSDGVRQESFLLSQDTDVWVNGSNHLIITGGRARITEADCPDGLCVRQHAIENQGESIICLPNKLVVTIEGGAAGMDAQVF